MKIIRVRVTSTTAIVGQRCTLETIRHRVIVQLVDLQDMQRGRGAARRSEFHSLRRTRVR